MMMRRRRRRMRTMMRRRRRMRMRTIVSYIVSHHTSIYLSLAIWISKEISFSK
jgi:hypothetical protein